MTVYKYFMKVAFRNKWIIAMYTAIFFLLTILTGSGDQREEADFVSTKLVVGIVDKSGTDISKGLVDYISSKNYIADISGAEDEDGIKENIFLETIDAALIIPENFRESIVNKKSSVIIYSDERKPETLQIQNQVNKYLTFANATYEDGAFDIEGLSEALKKETSVELIPSSGESESSGADPWFNQYFNFMSYVLTAIYIGTIGYVMSDFREERVESRRRISSIRLSKFNREVYLGQLTVAAVITALFILGAIVLKGGDIGEVNFFKYVLNTVVFSIAILCFTYLINNITRNRFIKNAISNVFSLGMAFISGVFIPQSFLSDTVLTIARFFPTYYFISLNDRSATSFLDMRYELSIQLFFAVIFLAIGILFSKKNSKAG